MKCLISSLLNIKIGSAFPWVWVPFSGLCSLGALPSSHKAWARSTLFSVSAQPQAPSTGKKKKRGLFGKVPFHAELSWNEKICGSWSKVLGSSSLWQSIISCQQHPSLPIGTFCVAETLCWLKKISQYPLGVHVLYTNKLQKVCRLDVVEELPFGAGSADFLTS